MYQNYIYIIVCREVRISVTIELFAHAQTTTSARRRLIAVTDTPLVTTLAVRTNVTATTVSLETASSVKVWTLHAFLFATLSLKFF